MTADLHETHRDSSAQSESPTRNTPELDAPVTEMAFDPDGETNEIDVDGAVESQDPAAEAESPQESALAFLDSLEARHNSVLYELEALNAKVERVLESYAKENKRTF